MLAKSKLNGIEVLISKALIHWNISHAKFVLINHMLKEYEEMKERNQKFKDLIEFIEDYSLFVKQCYRIVWSIESKNLKVAMRKNGRLMLLSKCAVCNSKKSNFIKTQEASGLLSSLGIKIPLNKTPLSGSLLF